MVFVNKYHTYLINNKEIATLRFWYYFCMHISTI